MGSRQKYTASRNRIKKALTRVGDSINDSVLNLRLLRHAAHVINNEVRSIRLQQEERDLDMAVSEENFDLSDF